MVYPIHKLTKTIDKILKHGNFMMKEETNKLRIPHQSSKRRNIFPANQEEDIRTLANHLFNHVTECLRA